jgi:cysteine-rich repeat protein
MPRSHFLPASLLVIPTLAACFNPHDPIVVTTGDSQADDTTADTSGGPGGDPTTASSTEPTGSTDPSASTTASTTDSADSSTSDTDPTEGTDTGTPLCGNMMLDGDEACDDGNDINGDGCNTDCVESGTLLWELVLPSDGGEAAVDVAVSDDDVVGFLWATNGPHIDTFDADGVPLDSLDGAAGEYWNSLDFFGNGEFAVSFADDAAIQVARISAAGGEVWSSTAPGSGAPAGYAAEIVTTDDDDVAFGGTGNAAIWAGKFDGGGPFDWSDVASIAAPGWAYGHGIGCELDGTCVVSGITDANGTTTGGKEFFLRRLSPGGTAIWTRTHPVDGYSETAFVAVTPAGDVALSGCDDSGCFTLRYTSDGDPKPTLVHDDLYTYGIAADVDGNLAIVGNGNRDDFSEGVNAIIKKFDPDGNELWTRSYNSTGAQGDESRGVATSSTGRIFVVGTTEQSEGDGTYDAWIRAYAP